MFSDPNVEILQKLLLAMALGGLIGFEREWRDKNAGFRTMVLIAAGATLFTEFSTLIGGTEDPARIAANVASGIGFLGAGVILKDGHKVQGLTTAATIWLTAAIGMGIASEAYGTVVIATILTLVVMWIFPYVEKIINHAEVYKTYEVTAKRSLKKADELEKLFHSHHLHIIGRQNTKDKTYMTIIIRAHGSANSHEAISNELFLDTNIETLQMR